MRISAIAPVLNEVDFIGYSILAALPGIESIHYGIDEKSNDGTFELVKMLAETKAKGKLFWYRGPDFNINPMDKASYNNAFNILIEAAIATSKPDGIIFLHPDMIVTNPQQMLDLENDDVLAWYTHIRSFAGDFKTEITRGRTNRWKNMHAPRFGLKYLGGYGSVNEDFYHSDITGTSLRHYGEEFSKYPFRVADSGIKINHYCELKDYRRRFEKMKLCLQTQHPEWDALMIEEMASKHPRVTLEQSSGQFGRFEFANSDEPIPEVITKYEAIFTAFQKEGELIHG